jgi:hypothetical protein
MLVAEPNAALHHLAERGWRASLCIAGVEDAGSVRTITPPSCSIPMVHNIEAVCHAAA